MAGSSTSDKNVGDEKPSNTTTAPPLAAGNSAPAPSGQEATDRAQAAGQATGDQSGDRKVDQGPIDPTDPAPDQAGGSTVIADGGAARDMSNPDENANVGYSAEGQVVSNQQGEQVNTVQAAEEDRAEHAEIAAGENGSNPQTAETDSGAEVVVEE